MAQKKDRAGKRTALRKIAACGILLAASFGLQFLSRSVNGFAEGYAKLIYPVWVNTIGRLMSLFPVSVVEVLLYLFILYILFGIIRIVFSRKGKRLLRFGQGCLSLLVFACALFLSYTLNCGINYHRSTFSEVSEMTLKAHSKAQLEALCEKLTDDVNRYSAGIIRNKKGLCVLDSDVDRRAVRAMERLGGQYEALDGYYPRPKPLIVPQILSYQQLSGIYSPFTVEANYNRHMTAYNIPFTACHELSHLRGFMREDEANFIAYLACIGSEDADFKYSGAMLGWIYASNALAKEDASAYAAIYEKLDPAVYEDLKANSAFWDKYEGKAAEIADKVNDTYLKANKQADGVKSYNRMVDLMLAFYEDQL